MFHCSYEFQEIKRIERIRIKNIFDGQKLQLYEFYRKAAILFFNLRRNIKPGGSIESEFFSMLHVT